MCKFGNKLKKNTIFKIVLSVFFSKKSNFVDIELHSKKYEIKNKKWQ